MVEPETRASLMLRLRQPHDQLAWSEFLSIYEPLILRLMRQRGIQEADARDVTQQVVVAVWQAVDRWQSDGEPASFRRWLFTIARNLSLKFLQRATKHQSPEGTDLLELLHSQPEPDQRLVATFDEEYRTELFRHAAERARGEFQESTWQAFWRTCVLEQPIATVADELGLSTGNVYVARSRIIARLKQLVKLSENEHVS